MGQGEEKAGVGSLSHLAIQPVAGVTPDLYLHTVEDAREQLQQQLLLPLCGCYSAPRSS